MRTVTIPYALAERLAIPPRDARGWTTWNTATASVAAKELRELLDTPVVDLEALDMAAISQAASESTWMPPEYCRNEWVADICSWLRDGPPRQKLGVKELCPGSGYYAWFTDDYGNPFQIGDGQQSADPFEVADWCERNGFAWEVIGLEGDPAQRLADWRAAQ